MLEPISSYECHSDGLFRFRFAAESLFSYPEFHFFTFIYDILPFKKLNFTEIDDPVLPVYQHIKLRSCTIVITGFQPCGTLRIYAGNRAFFISEYG